MPGPITNPKSSHTSDPVLRPFLGSSFDPTAYLNAHIPPLAFPTPAQPILPPKHQSLPDVAASASSHITQLAAQLSRLSDTLTALTDDILRGAPRLAYSVELLRGDANALAESTLKESLAQDVQSFVPEGLEAAVAKLKASEQNAEASEERAAASEKRTAATEAATAKDNPPPSSPKPPVELNALSSNPTEPAALARLRTLHTVRNRLAEVTAVYDSALAWPLPPSSRNLGATSFVSVSAPNPEDAKLEEQGLEAQRLMRNEVMDLLGPPSTITTTGKGGTTTGKGEAARIAAAEGVLRAEARIAELRELCEVWKGTAEEKPRTKFVEGLAKVVAERRKEEELRGALKRFGEEDEEDGERAREEGRKGGLFSGFRRLRDEMYLE